MLKIETDKRFERQLERLFKKHYDVNLYLNAIIALITDDRELLLRMRDHALAGKYHGYRELHIEKDWLLIYRRSDDKLTLVFLATGTHSQLFGI